MNLNDYEQAHLAAMRASAPECAVLLKSDRTFPLSAPCKVALYGSGARKTVKGGTGSGDVNSRFYVTAEKGLKNAGFTITTGDWMDAYDARIAEARTQFISAIRRKAKELHVSPLMLGMGAVMKEPDYDLPLSGEGDTAIYVLSRICGEGNDRLPEEGDLKLTKTEIRDIRFCRSKYKNFLLVLNVGGVMDLTPVLDVENILLLSQLGAVTGDTLADLILGNAYPSGKLTDSWCAWENYPTVGEFGARDETHYREGIYVGYRYLDSVKSDVTFPFGYGLSYTDFTIENSAISRSGRKLTITATVKNTGAHPGKEVVQLYATAPWNKLDHPYQALAAFVKTPEIAPGTSASVMIELDAASLASYDAKRSAYILEEGDYVLRLGTSSRATTPCAILRVESEIITRRLTKIGGDPEYADWHPGYSWNAHESAPALFTCSPADFADLEIPAPAEISPAAMSFVKELSDEALCDLCVGAHKNYPAFLSVIGNAAMHVAGAAGETCGNVPGIRPLIMADGPAGVRLNQKYTVDKKGIHPIGDSMPAGFSDFMPPLAAKLMNPGSVKQPKGEIHYQYCTAIPIGTAIAQSWSTEVARTCGDVVGTEMELFGIDMWLAPAFNIHRNPLCGRNFEYYSEDPLLSGIIGAAITAGVQSHPGRVVTVKHFCCNNQEFNRYQNNSCLSERALREIYLRPFELCIREANPGTLMTSYNLLNGVHTAERADLLKTVLREEWGWTGLVVTDWIIANMRDKACLHRHTLAAPAIKAGNDVFMPGGTADYKHILTALKGKNPDFTLTRAEVEFCAAHLVELVQKLGK